MSCKIYRDNSLDILKGFGILTMVMGHSNMGESFNLYIAGFHMQLFFLVSGYLFNAKKYELKNFIKRKTQSLLYPYVTFAIITILYCLLISLLKDENVYDFPNYLLGVIYSNRSIFPITGALWFLQCLFIVSVLFWFISRCKKWIGNSLICMFFILAYLQSYYDLWLPFALDSALSAIIFFFIGFKLQKFKCNLPLSFNKSLVSGILLIILTGISIYFNGPVNPRTCTYNNYILYYINAIIATLGWYFISYLLTNHSKIGDYLSIMGKDSIVFVGLNQLIITSLYQGFNLIYQFDSPIERATRNIFICVFTIIFLVWTTRIISNSKYKVFIGK